VPICDGMHWTLAVVCAPNGIRKLDDMASQVCVCVCVCVCVRARAWQGTTTEARFGQNATCYTLHPNPYNPSSPIPQPLNPNPSTLNPNLNPEPQSLSPNPFS
jgi:hypothetical protein